MHRNARLRLWQNSTPLDPVDSAKHIGQSESKRFSPTDVTRSADSADSVTSKRVFCFHFDLRAGFETSKWNFCFHFDSRAKLAQKSGHIRYQFESVGLVTVPMDVEMGAILQFSGTSQPTFSEPTFSEPTFSDWSIGTGSCPARRSSL